MHTIYCVTISLSLAFLYSLTCFTILQNASPSCGVHVFSVVFEKWGRFLLPMGAYSSRDRPKWGCRSFSLERHLLSRWLRLLMLPPSCFWFSCTQFFVWLSLSRILEAPSLDFSLRIVVSIVWLCVCSTEETNLWLVVPRFILFWTACKFACRDG